MFIKSDYARDDESHASRSACMVYTNTALVQWYSMKHSTVEASVFGTDFAASNQGIDALRGL